MLHSYKSTLRKRTRQQRRALSQQERYFASQRAFRWLSSLPIHQKKSLKIGIFIDTFSEMPTQILVDWARQRGHQVFLPVVIAHGKPLKFVKLTQKSWKTVRFPKHILGMRQPIGRNFVMAKDLDWLIMPLVALDRQGGRMGMGGGFYDRTLAKCKQKPIKIAWAYDFQLQDHLLLEDWDVRLDLAVLPSQLLVFRRYLL